MYNERDKCRAEKSPFDLKIGAQGIIHISRSAPRDDSLSRFKYKDNNFLEPRLY